MDSRLLTVLVVAGLVAGAWSLPAASLDYQEGVGEDAEEGAGGDKQLLTGAQTLLNVASLVPQVVRPLLNEVSTGLTNAITATIMGRAIAFIPPESVNPSR